MMMQLRWFSLGAPVAFSTIIIVIVLTQLHLIIAAPTSTVTPPADDVTDSVTWSRRCGTDVTERRQTVLSNGEVARSVRSNAAGSATNARLRRNLSSQGCVPVCNRCRQVRTGNTVLFVVQAEASKPGHN